MRDSTNQAVLALRGLRRSYRKPACDRVRASNIGDMFQSFELLQGFAASLLRVTRWSLRMNTCLDQPVPQTNEN